MFPTNSHYKTTNKLMKSMNAKAIVLVLGLVVVVSALLGVVLFSEEDRGNLNGSGISNSNGGRTSVKHTNIRNPDSGTNQGTPGKVKQANRPDRKATTKSTQQTNQQGGSTQTNSGGYSEVPGSGNNRNNNPRANPNQRFKSGGRFYPKQGTGTNSPRVTKRNGSNPTIDASATSAQQNNGNGTTNSENLDPNDFSNPGSISVSLKNSEGEPVVGGKLEVLDPYLIGQPLVAESDSQGFAILNNVRRDRQLTVQVSAYGFVAQQEQLSVGRPLTVNFNMTLTQAAAIRGITRDNNNKMVVGATVILASGNQTWQATSNQNGSFEIFAPPGTVGQVTAECRGYSRAQSDNAAVNGPDLELVMHDLAEATFTVKITPQSGVMPEQVRLDGQTLTPDADGVVTIKIPVTAPIKARQVYLEANNFKRHGFWVTPRAGVVTDLGAIELIPALSFYGEIQEVDSTGKVRAVPDLTIQSPDAPGLQVTTDAQGYFEIPAVPTPFILWIRADAHHQAHTIKIQAPTDPQTEAGFSPNKRRKIILARGRYKLTVNVKSEQNQPIAGVTVHYQNNEVVSDAQGKAVFDDVASNRSELRLTHDDYLTLRRTNVEASNSDEGNTIDVQLKKGTILSGVVSAFNAPVDSGVAILIQATQDWDTTLNGARPGPRSTPTNENGVYRFEDLKPGKYQLRVVGSSRAAKFVTIEADKKHTLNLDA